MVIELAGKLLPFLGLAVVCLFIGAVLVLPLYAFRRTRGFVALVLWLFTRVLGLTLWVWSLLVALVLWGWWAVVTGILLAGVGIVPVALLAACFEGHWGVFFQMLATTIVVIGANMLTGWMYERLES